MPKLTLATSNIKSGLKYADKEVALTANGFKEVSISGASKVVSATIRYTDNYYHAVMDDSSNIFLQVKDTSITVLCKGSSTRTILVRVLYY